MRKILILVMACFLLACQVENEEISPKPFVADYNMSDLPVSDLYGPMQELGLLNNSAIDEASGLAVSRQNVNFLWTHNDSGDFNRIFLIDNTGVFQGAFRLLGTGNRDWEDMAIGPGPNADITYLYIADIGDNRNQYNLKHIYRLPEPDISLATTDSNWVNIEGAERITFVYPGQKKVDAETLLLDPLTRDLYIVTKDEFPISVYHLPYPQSVEDTTTAILLGSLPFTLATAGEISDDGSQIFLKTKERIFLWQRYDFETVADALQREPIRVPYIPEPQGEAIAILPDGSGYYTLSEARGGVTPRVYFYPKK